MASHSSVDSLSSVTAPLATTARDTLRRGAIVDTERSVLAYTWAQSFGPAANDDARLFELLREARSEQQPGSTELFVRCTFEQMAEGCLRLLDPRRTILEVPTLARHTPEGIDIRRAMLSYARSSGFRLAFDHCVLKPEYQSWLPLASYVRIDVEALGVEESDRLVRHVREQTKAVPMAAGLRTDAQYLHLKGAGAALFEGDWFIEPPRGSAPKLAVSQAGVVRLLGLVSRDAEIEEVEKLFKRDPTLSFKLLRLINSPGFGLQVEIKSFKHAVMTLGMNGLYRWALLLLTVPHPGGPAPAAGTQAMVRGRLMELMGAQRLTRAQCDSAFMVGVLSLLDVLLEMDLASALEMISLPFEPRAALLDGSGPFGPYLQLARMCESGCRESVHEAAGALQLAPEQINRLHLEALAWVERCPAG